MSDITAKLDKAYEGKSVGELADAPVSALKGVSESDAAKLKEIFGIKTIRDLGTHKFFRWAQAITTLAE